MCSHSVVNELLGVTTATAATTTPGGGVAGVVPTISALQLRHRRNEYYLIDIREAEEIAADPLVAETDDVDDEDDDVAQAAADAIGKETTIKADIEVPMGKLLAKGVAEEWIDQRGIVLLCNTGYRSLIVARELAAFKKTKVMALQSGLVGLRNPAAIRPDFVVVLATHSNAEKITLALNAAAVAATAGDTVVLALMGDGVNTFLRKGNNKTLGLDTEPEKKTYLVETTFIGEPFSPCHALLKKFVASGNGVVLACQSCLKSRDIQLGSDLLDCVKPMQMPDLIRMLGQAKKTLQFM